MSEADNPLQQNYIGSVQKQGRFTNYGGDLTPGLGNILAFTQSKLVTKRIAPEPSSAIPLQQIVYSALLTDPQDQLYRLGHSSMLLKLDAELILIDPVFSQRSSPVQWMGPKRFHPVPLDIATLPQIKVVLISHDHYDHLDKAAIKQLNHKVERFIVPLGLKSILQKWGVSADRITELDWWQACELGSLSFTFTPAQHFSGRGLMDRNRTLWGGYAIQSRASRLFFTGDSGYFDGFKTIGERLGPFDIAMVETGAYNQHWADIHMHPEQSLQAFIDLQAKALLPIHNSTFDLSSHDWYEPLQRISELAEQHNIRLLTPIMGELVQIAEPQPTLAWWREMLPQQSSDSLLQQNL